MPSACLRHALESEAVTLAFAAILHFLWKQVPCYVAAHLTGAILACFTLQALLDAIQRLVATSPSGSLFQALTVEIVVTFSMMFATSAVATDTKAVGELAGIAVGSVNIITSILAGGSMNPVRTIRPAVASSYYKDQWVDIIGPVTGTLLGAWSYGVIRGSGNKPANEVSSSTQLKLRIIITGDNDAEDMPSEVAE